MKIRYVQGGVMDVSPDRAKRLIASGRFVAFEATTVSPESPEDDRLSEPTYPEVLDKVVQDEPVKAPEVHEDAPEPTPQGEDTNETSEASTDDIRAWARATRPDLNVRAKGKLSKAAVEAYAEAHKNN